MHRGELSAVIVRPTSEVVERTSRISLPLPLLFYEMRMFLKKKQIEKKILIFLEAYSEPSQTSKMEFFAKIVNGFQRIAIFGKDSTLIN